MSKPKTYELRNGTKVEVHTPFTTRAKELMQLYNGLNLPMLTVDERLDVLLHVKWTVKVCVICLRYLCVLWYLLMLTVVELLNVLLHVN